MAPRTLPGMNRTQRRNPPWLVALLLGAMALACVVPVAVIAFGGESEPTPAVSPSAVAPTSPAYTAQATRLPRRTTSRPAGQPTQKDVHPGAFCKPRGAYGLTSDGTLMRCKPSATDSRNRWREAG